MGLKAIDADTGEKVYSFAFGSRLEIKQKHPNLVCPFSNVEMFPRERADYIRHFVRKSHAYIPYDSHPESVRHFLGKELLYNEALRHIRDLGSSFRAEIEYPISINGRERGRIADLMILKGETPIFACEVQLSSITPESLEERTSDYQSKGIDVIWYFGLSAATKANKEWALSALGRYNEMTFPEIHSEKSDDPQLKEFLLNAV